MLVTVERYQAITGDETTAASAVSALVEEAVEELEELLDRPLESAVRTERMRPTRDGKLWPRATPVTVAADYTIDGLALLGTSWPWPAGEPWPNASAGVDVTYTGGWTAETLPHCIERDLATAAFILGHPVVLDAAGIDVAAGAKAASVGDVSITWGAAGAPGNSNAARLVGVWSRRTLSYRYRVERGV